MTEHEQQQNQPSTFHLISATILPTKKGKKKIYTTVTNKDKDKNKESKKHNESVESAGVAFVKEANVKN